jgi:hypothetical protein
MTTGAGASAARLPSSSGSATSRAGSTSWSTAPGVVVMRHSGRWLVAAEVAEDYGVVDEHGHLPASNRAQFLG